MASESNGEANECSREIPAEENEKYLK